jgi:hypothetical protein
MEMLLSLFMRMDETELESLMKQSGLESSFLFSSTKTTNRNSKGDSVEGEEKETFITIHNDDDDDGKAVDKEESNRYEKIERKQPLQSRRKRSQWEISPQRHNHDTDSSRLPILQQDCFHKDMGDNDNAEPFLIHPDDVEKYYSKKYKREGYASYDAKQLSQSVTENKDPVHNLLKVNGTNVSCQKLEPIVLKYNECSVRAISSWAFQSMDSPRQKIARGKSVDVFYQPVTATVEFRSCALCKKYGHYEVECEEVARGNVSKDWISRALQVEQKTVQEFAIQKTLRGFIRKRQKNVKYDLCARQNELKRILSPWLHIDDGKSKSETKNSDDRNGGDGTLQDKNTCHQVLVPSEDESSQANFPEVCEVCGTNFSVEDILLCDMCDKLYHRQCLDPPLDVLPEGDWFCDECKAYDSDVSSTTVIEGLDDYIIEQRKLSCADREMVERERDLRVDFRNNPWNVSVTIAEQGAEAGLGIDMEDPYYEGLGDFNHNNDSNLLAVGDLCWAKRRGTHTSSKTVYGRDFFWPGMVVCVHRNSIAHDGAIQTPYIVKFFNLSAGGRIRASHVLPFFQFYEALGYNRIKSYRFKNVDWLEDFQSAVLNAINKVDIKTLDDALTFSRGEYVGKELQGFKTTEHSSSKTAVQGSTTEHNRASRPKEWQDADETVVDGISILSKPKGIAGGNESEMDSAVEENAGVQGGKNQEMKDLLKEVMKFSPPENIIGSLVAYKLNERSTGENASVRFGVVGSFNKAFSKILIRHLPDIHDIITKQNNTVASSSTNTTDTSLRSFSTRLGSSEWISPKEVIYITNGPSKGNVNFCKSAVNFTSGVVTREKFHKYHQLPPIEKEYRMEERHPELIHDSMVSGSLKPSSGDASILTAAEQHENADEPNVPDLKSSDPNKNSGDVEMDNITNEKECDVTPKDSESNKGETSRLSALHGDDKSCKDVVAANSVLSERHDSQYSKGRSRTRGNNVISNNNSCTDLDVLDTTIQHDRASFHKGGKTMTAKNKRSTDVLCDHPNATEDGKGRRRTGDKVSRSKDKSIIEKGSLDTTKRKNGRSREGDTTGVKEKSGRNPVQDVLDASEHDKEHVVRDTPEHGEEYTRGRCNSTHSNDRGRSSRRGNSTHSKYESNSDLISVDHGAYQHQKEHRMRKGDNSNSKDKESSDPSDPASVDIDSSGSKKGPTRRNKAIDATSDLKTVTTTNLRNASLNTDNGKMFTDDANNNETSRANLNSNEKETMKDMRKKRSRSVPTTIPSNHGSSKRARSSSHSKSVDVPNNALIGNNVGNSRNYKSTNVAQASYGQKKSTKAAEKTVPCETNRKRTETMKNKHGTSNSETNLPTPTSSSHHGGGKIFQAERILADRSRGTNGGIREYLIKWKGFSNDHNSWENEHNILDKSFLKKYLCQKYLTTLKSTSEAKKTDSATARTIKALMIGIESLEKKHIPDTKATDDRMCPFCLKLVGGFKKIGGHLKIHSNEPNYLNLKDVSRFVEQEWFQRTRKK